MKILRDYDLGLDDMMITVNGPVAFMVNCSDIFWWGTADAERITPENVQSWLDTIEELESTSPKGEYWVHDANILWVCRHRKMRPQGAAYSLFPEALWPLIDACGPEREIGLGNPFKPGEYNLPN